MKRTVVGVVAVAGVIAALAAALVIDWDPERSRREAFVTRCNEDGVGGMFTSRQYCEELYARSKARRRAGNSS
jgi:hypothetical protein